MRNTLFIFIMCPIFHQAVFSQEIKTDTIILITTDSLLKTISRGQSTLNKLEIPELELETDIEMSSENFNTQSEGTQWKPSFETRFISPKLTYYEDEFIRVTPFNFELNNGFQGGWMGGINNHLSISDKLKANTSLYASSSFYGPFHPDRYNNTTLSFDIRYMLHERVRLVGFGEISLREGLNPNLAPMINGGYNFGGGVEFKVMKNFGIGVGFVNSYYKKNWTTTPYASPVVW